jgi:hypothetical protein
LPLAWSFRSERVSGIRGDANNGRVGPRERHRGEPRKFGGLPIEAAAR